MSFGVNGQSYQHALINLQATSTGAPFLFTRFKSVKYKMGAKKKPVKDSQGQIIKYTIGEQESDGSVSMLLEEWFPFRAWLRQQAAAIAAQLQVPVGIGQVEFDMTVQYGQTLATLQTDRLIGAMVDEESRESTDNQEVLVQEVPLFIPKITDSQGNQFINYR